MKKITNITVLISLLFILSSCFTSNDDINKAKQNLWIIEVDQQDKSIGTEIETNIINKDNLLNENNNEVNIEKVEKTIEINSLTEEQFLEFDNLDWENFLDWQVEITWKTLWSVDKIIVKFSNSSSDYPDDIFTLKQFTSWDDIFLYRAFSRFETLDFWKNIYIFEAYSWNSISKLQIIINVVKEEDKSVEEKLERSYEDLSLSSLPVWANYWNPVNLWDGKITYSDLNWLEIKKDINSELTCENLTSILSDKISTWFFWNTCRPIEWEEGISYFVIRLDWNNYVYEKHYYLSYQWIYWIQELEVWTWVTNQNIWDKNTELKESNEDYVILNITDDLFKEILK